MHDEAKWLREYAEATGHRKARMRRFIQRHGSYQLLQHLRAQERAASGGPRARTSKVLRRFVVPTASGKTWKVVRSARASRTRKGAHVAIA
jgi:hypothetical protein